MKSKDNILEIEDLCVSYGFPAVRNVSFELKAGSKFGLTGESGCGKSSVALAVTRLITDAEVRGRVLFNTGSFEADLLSVRERALRNIRGKELAAVFQESSLNPVIRVGKQLYETVSLYGKSDVKRRCLALLTTVGLDDAERVYSLYPHQLSAGMRSRVCLALALAGSPKLLIADEPTAALDSAVRHGILMLFRSLPCSMLLISHDFGVISQVCDCAAVMYAGSLVEFGSVKDIISTPLHPYTQGLVSCVSPHGTRLRTIAGTVPSPSEYCRSGCCFYDRCRERMPVCLSSAPERKTTGEGRYVCCHAR